MTTKRTLPDIVVGNTTHRVAKAGRHLEGPCVSGGYDHRWQLSRDSVGYCSLCKKTKEFGGQDVGLGAAIRAWQAGNPRKKGEMGQPDE